MLISLLLPCCFATDGLVLTRVDPAAKNGAMFLTEHGPAPSETTAVGGAIASFLKFYQDGGKNPVRFQCAADVDGDQLDELVVLRQRTSDGKVTLLVVEPPTKMLVKAPKISASYTSGFFSNPEEGEIVGLGRIDLDGDRKDEILFVRAFPDLTRKIDVHPAPNGKKTAFGAPLLSVSLAGMASDHEIIDAFGVDQGTVLPTRLALVQADATGATSLTIHEVPVTGTIDLTAPLSTISLDGSNTTVESVAPQSDLGHDPGGFVVLRRIDPSTQRIDLLRNDGTLSASQSLGTGTIPIRHCDSLQLPTPQPPPPPPPPLPTPSAARFIVGDTWGSIDAVATETLPPVFVLPFATSTEWTFTVPGVVPTTLSLAPDGTLSATTFSFNLTPPTGGIFRADIVLPPGPLPQLFQFMGTLRYGYNFSSWNPGTVGILTDLSNGSSHAIEVFWIELDFP